MFFFFIFLVIIGFTLFYLIFNLNPRARADDAFAGSPGDDTSLAGQPIPLGLPGVNGGPPTHKLMVGDWIAQWDASYNAWFFYNIKTGNYSVKSGLPNHLKI